MTVATEKPKPDIQLSVHDVDVLRYLYPEWDCLNKKQKLKLIKNTSSSVLRKIQIHNATCVDLHKYLAKNIDPEKNANESGDKIAFGDDDSSISSSDTSLNNKVGDVGISDTSYDSSSQETTFTTFVDSSELNGETLSEIGLIGTDSNLWNHADIDPDISKSNSETVVADIFISFTN